LSKFLKNNNVKRPGSSAVLKRAKRNIYWQAGLAMVTIVLTIVILFAMTAAWYTNIVQTSGLVFQAEAWGFEGNIKVENQSIVAAPGDEGLICLEVENTSSSIAAVSVSASKSGITTFPEMKRRLYFYVDTQMQRNGETMERVYLNSLDSYTYTLFGNGKLVLSEDTHTDAQMKWQWVYDVLGYYVLGMPSEDGKLFTEMEYLRPVEYNYDDATFDYETDEMGLTTIVLKTVDGETTVEEFLAELSEKDGYEEDIDFKNPVAKGYYPVDVDENGYGVYVYLCNYSEIEQATKYDTELGNSAAQNTQEGVMPTYPVQLNVSAQKNDENIVSVTSLSGLNAALEMMNGTVIQLNESITLNGDDQIRVPEGADLILDMNGHTITSNSGGNAIYMNSGSTLTMTNGELKGGTVGTGIYSVGAEVMLHNMEINGFVDGIYVADFAQDNELDSRIRIVQSKISTNDCAVYLTGNGSANAQRTQLLVEDSVLQSDNVVIYGNGDTTGDGKWGTDIQILNSKIIANNDLNKITTGIYHPQMNSELTIYNSEVSGYTGVAVKGGTVHVIGSTITGTGQQLNGDPIASNNGCADTGDAFYIETNYGYDIFLEVKGLTLVNEDGTETYKESFFDSPNNRSLRVNKASDPNVVVRIYSGRFQQAQPDIYIAKGSEQLTVNNLYEVRISEEENQNEAQQ